MHRDKKVGLALGILLVGIVAAIFFRNDPIATEELPELTDAERIDQQIEERAKESPTPYPSHYDQRDSDEPATGSEEIVPRDHAKSGESPFYEKPDFVGHGSPQGVLISSPNSEQGGIPLDASAGIQDLAVSNPNQQWQPIPEFSEQASSDMPKANEASSSRPVSGPADSRNGRRGGATPSAEPRYHVIRAGDTLSELASRYLGSSRRYREIYSMNRDVLKSPDDLPVGVRIRIPQRQRARRPQSEAATSSLHDTHRRSSAEELSKNVSISRPRSSDDEGQSSEGNGAANSETGRTGSQHSPGNRRPSNDAKSVRPQAPTPRFSPVRRNPLLPTRSGFRSSQTTDPTPAAKVLTQVAPPDVPTVDVPTAEKEHVSRPRVAAVDRAERKPDRGADEEAPTSAPPKSAEND